MKQGYNPDVVFDTITVSAPWNCIEGGCFTYKCRKEEDKPTYISSHDLIEMMKGTCDDATKVNIHHHVMSSEHYRPSVIKSNRKGFICISDLDKFLLNFKTWRNMGAEIREKAIQQLTDERRSTIAEYIKKKKLKRRRGTGGKCPRQCYEEVDVILEEDDSDDKNIDEDFEDMSNQQDAEMEEALAIMRSASAENNELTNIRKDISKLHEDMVKIATGQYMESETFRKRMREEEDSILQRARDEAHHIVADANREALQIISLAREKAFSVFNKAQQGIQEAQHEFTKN